MNIFFLYSSIFTTFYRNPSQLGKELFPKKKSTELEKAMDSDDFDVPETKKKKLN